MEQSTAETLVSIPRLNTRKPHKKSRFGCVNCKARRVKCDEEEPECLRCTQKGIVCKYNKMHRAGSRAKYEYRPIRITKSCQSLSILTCSSNPTTATLINECLLRQNGAATNEPNKVNIFEVSDVLRLQHFQNATCYTIGSSRIQQVYQAELTKTAVNHIHLMHAILTLSSMHIRSLGSASRRPSPPEIYHWQQTLARFGQKVAPCIDKEDAGAMLATATLVNGIAFAMVEVTEPKYSWPFSSKPDDLQWLSLQGGIALILQAVQPLRGESVLEGLFIERMEEAGPCSCSSVGFGGLPPQLLQLCQVTVQSTTENNPYYAPLQILAPLLELECTSESLLDHLSFIGSIRPEYAALLRVKDHTALLILSYWYATICSLECWWTAPRSRTECKAICMYLEKYADNNVQELLPFPADACGYRLGHTSSFTEGQVSQGLMPCYLM